MFAALAEALEELRQVDYAFVDGHHQEGPTIEYFRKIGLRGNFVWPLVFDAVNWSDGMKRARRTATASPRVLYPMNLHTLGVCVYGKR